MWSMQSYQYQAEEIRQQYNNMIAAKDYEVGTNSLCENTYSLKGRNLDSRTRTSFNFKFSSLFSKIDTPESFILLFPPAKLAHLFVLKKVNPSADR